MDRVDEREGPSILDVMPEDVRPYDALDEGRVVISCEFGGHGVALEIGSLEVEEIDGPNGQTVWSPTWHDIERRVYAPDAPRKPMRVVRGWDIQPRQRATGTDPNALSN